MPENQSQPRTEGLNNPQGSPQVASEAPNASEGVTSNTPPDHLAPNEARSFAGGDLEGRINAPHPPESEGVTSNVPPDKLAHAPQEGRPGFEADAEGRIDPPSQPGPDRRADYGGGNMGHSRPGTDALTAGAEFADRMPEASSTPAVDGDIPGTKKSPTS